MITLILQRQNGTWQVINYKALKDLEERFPDPFFFDAFMNTVVSAGGEERSEQAETIIMHTNTLANLDNVFLADVAYHAGGEGKVLGTMQIRVEIREKSLGMEAEF